MKTMDVYQQQEQEFLEFINEKEHPPTTQNGTISKNVKSPTTSEIHTPLAPSKLSEKPLTGLQCLFALSRILETSARLHQLNAGLEEKIGYLNEVRELMEIQNELQAKVHGRDVNANSLHNQSLDEIMNLSHVRTLSKSKSNESLPLVSEKNKLSLADDRKHSGLPSALKFGKSWDVKFGRNSISSAKLKRSKTNDMSVVEKFKYRQSLSSDDTLSITSAPAQTAFIQRQFNIPSVDSEDFGGVYLGEEPDKLNGDKEKLSEMEDSFGGVYLGPADHETSDLQSGTENSQLSLSSPVTIEQFTVIKQRKISEPVRHQPIVDNFPRLSLDDSNIKTKKPNKTITNKVLEVITSGSAEKTQSVRKSPSAERKPKTSTANDEEKLKVSKNFARKIDEWNQIKSSSLDKTDGKENKIGNKKSTGGHQSRDKGKTKAQRFKGRKKGLLKGRSKSADRLKGSDEDFNQKLIEWSIMQGHQPDYYLNAPQNNGGSMSLSNGALDSSGHAESPLSADYQLKESRQNSNSTSEITLETLAPPTKVLLRHGDIRRNLSKSDEALQTKSRLSSFEASSSHDIYTENLDSSLEKHLSLRYLDIDVNSVDRLSIKTDDLDMEVQDPEVELDTENLQPKPTEDNVTPTEPIIVSAEVTSTPLEVNAATTDSLDVSPHPELQLKRSSDSTDEVPTTSCPINTDMTIDTTNNEDTAVVGDAHSDYKPSSLTEDTLLLSLHANVVGMSEQSVEEPVTNDPGITSLEGSGNRSNTVGKPKVERTISKSVSVDIGDSPYEFLMTEPSAKAIQSQKASSEKRRANSKSKSSGTTDFDTIEHSSVIRKSSISVESSLAPESVEPSTSLKELPASTKDNETIVKSTTFDFDRVEHSSSVKEVSKKQSVNVENFDKNNPTIFLDFEECLKYTNKEQKTNAHGLPENKLSSPDNSIEKGDKITDFDSVTYSGKPEQHEPFSSESSSETTTSSESLSSAQEDLNDFNRVQFSKDLRQHRKSDTPVCEEPTSPISPTIQRLTGIARRPNRMTVSDTGSESWIEAGCDINSNKVPLGQSLSMQSASQMSIASQEYVTAPTTPLDDPIYLGPEVPLKAKLKSLAMAYQVEDDKRLQESPSIKTTRPNSMSYEMPPLRSAPVLVSHTRSRSNDELLTNSLASADTNHNTKSDKMYRYELSPTVKSGVYRLKSADELLLEKNAMIEKAKRKNSNGSRQTTGMKTPNVLELSYHRKKDEVPKQGTVKKAMSIFSSRESNFANFGMDYSGK